MTECSCHNHLFFYTALSDTSLPFESPASTNMPLLPDNLFINRLNSISHYIYFKKENLASNFTKVQTNILICILNTWMILLETRKNVKLSLC